MSSTDDLIVEMHKMAVKFARRKADPEDIEEVLDFLAVDVTNAVRRWQADPVRDIGRVVGRAVLNRISKVRQRRYTRNRYLSANQVPDITPAHDVSPLDMIPGRLQDLAAFLISLGRPYDQHTDGISLILKTGMGLDEAASGIRELQNLLTVIDIDNSMKVCIDPGHGMSNARQGVYDPGATGGGIEEADIALQWALTGKWILNQAGIDVLLTRDDDRDPTPVSKRAGQAEAGDCDVLVSLHCNAGGGTGVETYVRGADDVPLAQTVQGAAVKATGGKDRGVKHESETRHKRLAVLGFDGPAVLVELGFIDSSKDREWLVKRATRIAFWNGVKQGLMA